MPELLIAPKFLPFVEKKKRFKVAIGGRGSGKSMTFAGLCLKDAQVYGIKTGCFREFQNSIDDSVHAILKAEVERLGLQGFDCQQAKILLNGEEVFKFRGLARNPEGVKSMHGFRRFWVEEAQTISEESLKNLTPTLREDDSEIWFSGNLRSMADPFSQKFFAPFEKQLRATGYYEDDLHLIVWVNYNDNPFFPDVLEQERAFDQEHKSTAMYRHIWLGEPYDEMENSIIPVEWFEACIDAHKKLGFEPEGAIVAAHDPSDTGADAKGYALRHGVVFLDVDEMTTGDGADGCRWALDKALAAGADHFVWEAGGMGGLLKPQVDRALSGKHVDWSMFKGSEGVDHPEADYLPVDTRDPKKRKRNREALLNKRAQSWMDTARRCHNTYLAVEKGVYINPLELISFDSGIQKLDQLRAEMCRIPLKRNNSGKIQIMSKKELESLRVASPNMGDSVNMCSYYVPEVKSAPISIKFTGWGN